MKTILAAAAALLLVQGISVASHAAGTATTKKPTMETKATHPMGDAGAAEENEDGSEHEMPAAQSEATNTAKKMKKKVSKKAKANGNG